MARLISWRLSCLCKSYVRLGSCCDYGISGLRSGAHSGDVGPAFFWSFAASRSYTRRIDRQSTYNLFDKGKAGYDEFKKTWTEEMGDVDSGLWTGSEDEGDDDKSSKSLKDEIRRLKQMVKEKHKIDTVDSDELHSMWSESDEEKTLWTGDEDYTDTDDDISTDSQPNETSDAYIDKLFEFEEEPKYKSFAEALEEKDEPEEMTPGRKARLLAVENALKKLKKGPDGRYINVWEVMSDMDIIIGAFDNIVSGPEYEELRKGGPKRLNMEYFKDIQRRMRDPNYEFSPEIKLKPKSKIVPRKKWLNSEARKRKARNR